MIQSFRARLLFGFMSLAAAVLLVSFIAISWAIASQSERTLERELEVSERVFAELMEVRTQQLQQAAEVLTTDFGFREAVASSDQDTIISALVNHGERIGTELIVLQSPQGDEIAATHASNLLPNITQLSTETTAASDRATQLVLVEEQIFQIVTVPVRAPDLIAWATLGFAVNDDLAKLMRQLTLADITFMNQRTGKVYATSLEADLLATIAKPNLNVAALANEGRLIVRASSFVELGYAMSKEAELMMVLSADKSEATAEFSALQRQYALIALGILTVAVLLAVVTARKISQPVRGLTEAARRLGKGDYSQPIQVNRKDEFGALGQAFETMRIGISEREQQILYQVEHDLLTGLPNRASLRRSLTQALASKQQGHLILLNVARFREVNDRFGQQVGDQLLQAIAQRLVESITEHWWIGRLAGDEFVLIGENQSQVRTQQLLTQLEQTLAQPWWLAQTSYLLEFRVGYLEFPNVGDDADSLLRRAQICARFAKQHKCFAVAYEQGMDEQHLRRLQIVQALPSAVREHRLQLHFQPKLNCHTGQVYGVEALLRWRDEQLGVVRPDEFIPLAEQTGEINRLTRWVCTAALDQVQLWQEQGRCLSVAINLSALDLQWAELVPFLQQQTKLRGVTPETVTLEVTESAIMAEPEQAIERLQQLRQAGFKIAIDDYGTGYASLAQLKRLPVDELKLDRSFIQDIAKNSDDLIIVRSTIALAHELNLKTVAEGIEDRDAWQLLQQLDCDTVQGYYFSRPLAASSLEQWLTEYQGEHS